MQQDLDQWRRYYNEERTHSGKYCYGKTPMQTFTDSIYLAKEKRIDELLEKVLILMSQKKRKQALLRSNLPGIF
jgi:hypothetical protein